MIKDTNKDPEFKFDDVKEVLQTSTCQSSDHLRKNFKEIWLNVVPRIKELEEDSENAINIQTYMKKETTKALQEFDKA